MNLPQFLGPMLALASSLLCSLLLVFPEDSLAESNPGKTFSRFEIGGQLSNLAMNRVGNSTSDFGVGGTLSVNFSDRLSWRSQANYFPEQHPPTSQDGGTTLTFFSGLRARAMTRRKFSFSWEVQPGLMSFSQASIRTSAVDFMNRRLTHFALNLGGSIEYFLSRRAILQLGVGANLLEIHSRTFQVDPNLSIISPGSIRPVLAASLGAAYTLGQDISSRDESRPRNQRAEVGVEFVTLASERSLGDVTNELGAGSVFAYSFDKYWSMDASFVVFPKKYNLVDFQQGGSIIQGLVGVKVGWTQKKVGVFCKARPGFQRYSLTVQDFTSPTGIPHTTGTAHLVLDVGTVIEFYPSKHTAIRFDVGDVMRFQRSTQLKGVGLTVPGRRFDTIQLATGPVLQF